MKSKKTSAYIWGICGLALLLVVPLGYYFTMGKFDFRLMVIAPIAGIGFISRYASLMREYKSEVNNNDNEYTA